MRPRTNAVAREILRNNLRAVVDDMSAALEHNCPSPVVSEERDYAVAFADATGEIVIAENAVHMPSLEMTAKAILDYYQYSLRAGDLVATNDPFSGGTHVQDLTLFAPVYGTDELLGALLVRVHASDFGGQYAGGYNPLATELWAEGIRIRPVKLARLGRLDRDVFNTLRLNSRLPEEIDRLLDTMRATLDLGEQRVRALVAQYGFEVFREGAAYALDYAEAATRERLRGWPNGRFDGSARVGHDCTGRAPVVRCTMEVCEGTVEIDFSASDPQSASFVNSAWGWTCGSALLPVLTALGEPPLNSGVLRAVRFTGADGTLVRPGYPAAVGMGQYHPACEVINAVSAALTACTGQPLPLMPPQVLVSLCFPPYRFLSLDSLLPAGAGDTPAAPGWGPPSYFARRRLLSVERTEMSFPEISIEQLELAPGRPPHDGPPAPGCELIMHLHSAARITAYIGTPAEPGTGGQPSCSFRSGGAATEVDAFVLDRIWQDGTVVLRTASGPSRRARRFA
jgi:N-methylhydantoinase B